MNGPRIVCFYCFLMCSKANGITKPRLIVWKIHTISNNQRMNRFLLRSKLSSFPLKSSIVSDHLKGNLFFLLCILCSNRHISVVSLIVYSSFTTTFRTTIKVYLNSFFPDTRSNFFLHLSVLHLYRLPFESWIKISFVSIQNAGDMILWLAKWLQILFIYFWNIP